jgi:hypothetical protein
MTPEEYFRKTGKRARRLRAIVVNEISAVDMPATGERFLVLKSKRGGEIVNDKLKNLVKEFLGDFDIEKALGEDAAAAVAKSLEILNRYREDFPDDVLKACQILAAAIGKDVESDSGELKPLYSDAPKSDDRIVFKRSADKWPSMVARVGENSISGNAMGGVVLRPASFLKSENEEEANDESVPFVRGRGLRKSVLASDQVDFDSEAGGPDPEDLWPSLSRA